jgi:hypothetical protein
MITIKKCDNAGVNQHFDNGEEFYYMPVIDGKEAHSIAETYDMAMLVGIGIKYDGKNTQFPTMAARMLKIKSQWAE